MKHSKAILLGIILTSSLYLISCDDATTAITETVDEIIESQDSSATETTNSTTLSDVELDDLLHLAEEEKLARDVYLYAYEIHGLSVSKNISKSEQTHMDKVIETLASNGIDDPTHPDQGLFYNETLQELYDQLTAQVDSSLLDALLVGATIEDLDIFDIDEFLAHTTNEELIAMYENLTCGSRNHMRAYYRQIKAQNSDYTPQYISQTELDAIIAANHEKCGRK